MQRDLLVLRTSGALVYLYGCWMGMLALHEYGHVINTIITGGKVVAVRIPLFGFSQTFVNPNPWPLFVAWGGAVLGSAIPQVACGMALLIRGRVPEPLKFFAGFCLVANGLYIGLGWLGRGNDSADLAQMGVPWATLITFGIAATTPGLLIWHKLSWLTLRR
jgi:hypothetical protein